MKTKLSKALSLILAFVLCFSAMIPASAADEIPEGYTPIYTAEDLNNIRNNLSGSYILMNDIDLSAYENWEPIGSKETPFAGTLDGNSKIISNLKITSVTDEGYAGLFGYAKDAQIKNLTVDGNIEVCPEIASYIGMLFGEIYGGNISQSISSGSINIVAKERTYAGGLFGNASGGTQKLFVKQNINNAKIDVEVEKCSQGRICSIGGISGQANAYLSECVNRKNVYVLISSPDSKERLVSTGGIVGYNSGLILDCYNVGDVSVSGIGNLCTGGIVGYWWEDYDLTNTYNTGKISVNVNIEECSAVETGAIVGYAEPSLYAYTIPVIRNCFYLNNAETLTGSNSNIYEIINVKKLTSEEMKNQESFVNFDFENIWVMVDNSFPIIRNQPTIREKRNIELKTGEVFSLASFKSFNSSDESIAEINENGEIIALSSGVAIVSVELSLGYIVEYTVTVTDPAVTPEPPTDPEPACWLLRILNLIKKAWSIVFKITNSFLKQKAF